MHSRDAAASSQPADDSHRAPRSDAQLADMASATSRRLTDLAEWWARFGPEELRRLDNDRDHLSDALDRVWDLEAISFGTEMARKARLASADVAPIAPRAYISSDDAVLGILTVAAIQQLLRLTSVTNSLALSASGIREVRRGSIWLKFRQGVQRLVTSEEAQQIADQTRQGLEANFIESAQSQNALNMARGIAEIMGAAKDIESLAIDAGQFVLAKVTDEDGKEHWRAKARSSRDIAASNISDKQLQDPRALFELLDGPADGP